MGLKNFWGDFEMSIVPISAWVSPLWGRHRESQSVLKATGCAGGSFTTYC
jgi:hypothetical protein